MCCVGREAQGYATLALPSVTLMSGSGDRAARGLLRVLWQDCCGSRWGRKLISRPEVWGGRLEVWGGRYGGRGPGKYLPEQQTGVGSAPFSSACKEAESLASPYLRSSIASHLQPVLLGDIGGSSGQMEGDIAHRAPGWGEAMGGHHDSVGWGEGPPPWGCMKYSRKVLTSELRPAWYGCCRRPVGGQTIGG